MSTTTPREILGSGKFVQLVRENSWEYLHRPGVSGIVVIVAFTPDERLLLVEQWRQPVGAHVIELPAGLAGDIAGEENEPLERAARRELLEETGWDAGSLEWLCRCPPSPGATSELMTFYRARDLKRVDDGGGDEHESIVVHAVPLASLDAWLAAREAEGRLIDMKVFAGLELLHRGGAPRTAPV